VTPATPSASSPQESPSPSTAEPVTLKVWIAGESGTVNAQTELLDAYHQLHPNVTIETTFQGTELTNPSLLPALASGNGPDIFASGTGPGQPQAIINAGYALNLAPYYFQYGWDKVIPKTVVDYTSSDGKLWAIGDSVETTMFFYNKSIFDKVGVTPPTTWAEFKTVADKLKAAGYDSVIGLAGADKWPISHEQSWLWGDYAGPDGINNVMFADGKWTDQPFVDAMQTLVDLNKAGYFGKDPLAISFQDYIAKFWRGETPMTFTGTFVIGDAISTYGANVLDNFGAFAAPNPSGGPIYPSEDIGAGWYIYSKSPHPDEAAALLDYLLFQPDSRKKLIEGGLIPVGDLDLTGVNLPSLQKAALDINNQYRSNGTIHAFLDTVMPANTTDLTYDGLQAMLAGKMTPTEFCQSIQKAWEEAKAKGDILKPGGEIQKP
jgi:raffinose/stachyose/melibiose transport system substrate-binding protein